MLPFRDVHTGATRRRFPFVTVGLITLNATFFYYELTLDGKALDGFLLLLLGGGRRARPRSAS